MDKNTIKQRVAEKFHGMNFRGTSNMTKEAIYEVVFLGDGTPDINLTCCEFTRTSFINALPSNFLIVYTLPSLEAENVKIIGKFTWEESSVSGGSNLKSIKLLTMTFDRRED